MSGEPGSGEGVPQPAPESAPQAIVSQEVEELTPEQRFSITGLEKVRSPQDLLDPLSSQFSRIDAQSRDDARRIVAEKAVGLIDFYKSRSRFSRLSGIGGKSIAQEIYGSHTSAWKPQDISLFIDSLTHRGLITEEQAQKIRDESPGRQVPSPSSTQPTSNKPTP